jgi:hypothetical protein
MLSRRSAQYIAAAGPDRSAPRTELRGTRHTPISMRALLAAAVLLLAPLVQADDASDRTGAVIQRDRMTEDFARSLQQDRRRMDVPATDARRSQALEQQFIRQNQSADNLGARQDLDMRTRRGDAGQAQYDAQRYANERRAAEAAAARDAEADRRDEAARERRERPEPYSPTLDPPRQWGPHL